MAHVEKSLTKKGFFLNYMTIHKVEQQLLYRCPALISYSVVSLLIREYVQISNLLFFTKFNCQKLVLRGTGKVPGYHPLRGWLQNEIIIKY